jgi:hypothetical protein
VVLHVSGASHADHDETRRSGDQPCPPTPRWSGLGAVRLQTYAINPYRLGDILEPLLTKRFEAQRELVFYLVSHSPRYCNAARLGQLL